MYDSTNGWHWSTSKPDKFCCNDNDCSGYDPDKHTKIVCDCPSRDCRLHESKDYRCKALPSCKTNPECGDDWCCDKLVGGKGECKGKGTVIKYNGKSYICDPPAWESEVSGNRKQVSLVDLILNFFSNLFS